MPTWKKILYDSDTIPAANVSVGVFGGSGGATFPGAVAADTVNEKTSGNGVSVDGCLIKDGAVVGGETISRAWLGV